MEVVFNNRIGVDETFHPEICLVAIEPVSNFILLERYAADRSAATWTQALEQCRQLNSTSSDLTFCF